MPTLSTEFSQAEGLPTFHYGNHIPEITYHYLVSIVAITRTVLSEDGARALVRTRVET